MQNCEMCKRKSELLERTRLLIRARIPRTHDPLSEVNVLPRLIEQIQLEELKEKEAQCSA